MGIHRQNSSFVFQACDSPREALQSTSSREPTLRTRFGVARTVGTTSPLRLILSPAAESLPRSSPKLITSYARDGIASPNALATLTTCQVLTLCYCWSRPISRSSPELTCFSGGHGMPVLGWLDYHMRGVSRVQTIVRGSGVPRWESSPPDKLL
jgi:hypothetical protein